MTYTQVPQPATYQVAQPMTYTQAPVTYTAYTQVPQATYSPVVTEAAQDLHLCVFFPTILDTPEFRCFWGPLRRGGALSGWILLENLPKPLI